MKGEETVVGQTSSQIYVTLGPIKLRSKMSW